jgi:hypothetical protein
MSVKQGVKINAKFPEGTTFDQAMARLYRFFLPFSVHCVNCYEVHRAFKEAHRGFMIGQGHARADGTKFGRSPITAFDDIIAETGRMDEVSFIFQGTTIIATINKFALHIKIARRDEWSQELIEHFQRLARFGQIFASLEVVNIDCKGEVNLFYTDLLKRLEEGDFEGWEDRSRYIIKESVDACST